MTDTHINYEVYLQLVPSVQRLHHGLSYRGIVVRFPARARHLKVLQNVQNCIGVKPGVLKNLLSGVKRPGRYADLSLHLLFRQRFRMSGVKTPLPRKPSWYSRAEVCLLMVSAPELRLLP